MAWTQHLLIAPILLPLVTAASMLLIDAARQRVIAMLNVASTVTLLLIAVALLRLAWQSESAVSGVYLLGNWPAPFGIVLVADRLSTLMVALAGLLGVASLSFALARWHRAGVYFHPIFQIQLMGVNGAFLTGDLFNLFVFFELMLAASYGLLLHGSGAARVKAGLHYITIGLTASMLFLIGVSLLYSVTGTLNMADMAERIASLEGDDRVLLEVGAAVLGVAFLVKAGMWPLNLWLPGAYAAAAAPSAALFAILTKVGVYVVLRLSLLLFGDGAGASAGFGADWLLIGGLLTIAFGAIGALGSQDVRRLAGHCVLISSGTLLAAIGIGDARVTGAALFYLVSSTLAISAFFLLIELAERGRVPGADVLAVTMEAFGPREAPPSLDDEGAGIAIPAALAAVGIAFVLCALLLAGLPPVSGFIGKFALLSALVNPSDPSAAVSVGRWAMLALVILSGLAVVVAMARAGIRTFWAPPERTPPRVRVIEFTPVAVLLALCAALAARPAPVFDYLQTAADALHAPDDYREQVLAALPAERRALGSGESAR
ncbi:MAG TPA: monovalent cation/H+ antiporter subunit D [Pseudomonadales bacterium]